jgi:hypothetical protein
MLTEKTLETLSAAKHRGWVLESDAKEIPADAEWTVPELRFADTSADAMQPQPTSALLWPSIGNRFYRMDMIIIVRQTPAPGWQA